MRKTGKFYVKLGLPEGTSFPTGTHLAEGDLFYRTDEDRAYCYTGSGWVLITVPDLGEVGTVTLTSPIEGEALRYNATLSAWINSGIAAGAGTFLGLTDTPSDYTGYADYAITVKSTEDGLEFSLLGSGGGASTWTGLTDTPSSYVGYSGYFPRVTGAEDGLTFGSSLRDVHGKQLEYTGDEIKGKALTGVGSIDGEIFIVGGESEYTTISSAISAAAEGDLILVLPGTYTETVAISKGVTVRGTTRDGSVIDGQTTISDANAQLENISVIRSVDTSSVVYSIILSAAAKVQDCYASCTNAGTGAASAIGVDAAGVTPKILFSEFVAVDGSNLARGMYVADGTPQAIHCEFSGEAYDVEVALGKTCELIFCTAPSVGGSGTATYGSFKVEDLDIVDDLNVGDAVNVDGLVSIDGASDNNIFLIGETAFDIDLTATTKANARLQGIITTDDDDAPDYLYYPIEDTLTYSAGNGWYPTVSNAAYSGPGLIAKLARPGNWEFTLEFNLDMDAITQQFWLWMGYLTNDNHVGYVVRAFDAQATLDQIKWQGFSADGDDTFTGGTEGTAISNPSGTYVLALRSYNGIMSYYDDQADSWTKYTARNNAGHSYTASNVFVQIAKNPARDLPSTLYLENIKLVYLLGGP